MSRVYVLNRGYVHLADHMGSDLSIVRSARVSHDAVWRAGRDGDKDSRLINYLYRNKHTTPFESVVFTFEVKAPIFVLRQWHRHRTQCLSGDTRIKFACPADGKPYWKTIGEIADQWFIDEIEVKRPDKQIRTLREFNRDRIKKMRLYCIEDNCKIAKTSISDVIISGEKEVFEITANGNTIKASKDHKFKTPAGWRTLEQLAPGDNILTIKKIAPKPRNISPPFTCVELNQEMWRATDYVGAEVSRLVAETFLTGHGHVLHIDDCPQNNRISNLKYGNDKDNHNDALSNGRRAFNGVSLLTIESIEYAGIEMTYDIEVTHRDHNFIAENFCTHNSYNEMSARYTELPDEFYVPGLNYINPQDTGNKQMRTQEQLVDAKIARDLIIRSTDESYNDYKQLLQLGVARELARSVLPVSIYSKMFTTVNLHNLFHFLRLRLHEHAQYEIRVYAEAMLELISPIVPVAVKAFKEDINYDD